MAGISLLDFSNVQNTAATSSQSGASTTNKELQNVGQDQFLKLLVAQLQNQDPLNPVQNDQFISQLATFSSLEQLISINKAVQQLADTSSQQTGNTNKVTS